LGTTPDLPAFYGRLVFFGNTFGEAAVGSQNSLSWQVTSVGDPLYRPFWQTTDKLEKQLRARGSDLVAWSNLLEANQNLAANADRQVVIKFLQKSEYRHSPILQEKVANLFLEQKRFNLAAETFEEVLKTATSRGQRVRVLYALGDVRSTYGPDIKAYEAYLRILKENPDYPEKGVVYQKLAPLARRLGKREDERGYTQDMSKLPTGASK
jgi:tetratricopeptide (TPR) repeat protein